MHKSNRKLKILYKCIKAKTNAILIPNCLNKTKDKSYSKSLLFPQKWRFRRKNRSGEWAKGRKVSNKNSEKESWYKKVGLTWQPWYFFQTGGRHQNFPGLPSGGLMCYCQKTAQQIWLHKSVTAVVYDQNCWRRTMKAQVLLLWLLLQQFINTTPSPGDLCYQCFITNFPKCCLPSHSPA